MEKYITPILKNNKCFILAYDHGFSYHSLESLDAKNAQPDYIFDIATEGGFTGIVLHKGLAEYFKNTNYANKIPLIIKLDGNTSLVKTYDPRSINLCSVSYAKKLGAVAVGYTIYLGSEFEKEMLEQFSQIQEEAHRLKMGVIAWIYPRGKNISNENNDKLTKFAVRVGLEIGADMVKINLPQNLAILQEVLALGGPMKIALAGGEKMPEPMFLDLVNESMMKGVNGFIIGRNIWQCDKPIEFAQKITKIIW